MTFEELLAAYMKLGTSLGKATEALDMSLVLIDSLTAENNLLKAELEATKSALALATALHEMVIRK